MITIRMAGGLGNQFFQYAAARSLANKHGTSIGIDTTSIDASGEESHFRRKFKLDMFNVKFEKLSLKEIRKYVWISGNNFIDDYLIKKYCLFEKNVWRDNGNISEFGSLGSDICLIGYFVNPDYFKNIKKILIEELCLKDLSPIQSMLNDIKNSNSVSIHVRRGDLLKLKNSYILSEDYYKKAIRLILEKTKNPIFYIFSDDIEWCKKSFPSLKNKVIVEGNDPSQDFELMKNCKHNILANSTFSWWAGYLNTNKNHVIIAPEHFSVFDVDHLNMYPDGWEVISNGKK